MIIMALKVTRDLSHENVLMLFAEQLKALAKHWQSIGKALAKHWQSIGKALPKHWHSIGIALA